VEGVLISTKKAGSTITASLRRPGDEIRNAFDHLARGYTT
jgi:hypothetical protein